MTVAVDANPVVADTAIEKVTGGGVADVAYVVSAEPRDRA